MKLYRILTSLTVLFLILSARAQTPSNQSPSDQAPSEKTPTPYFESITQLQQQLSDGQISSAGLTQDFLKRIATLDRNGPSVNSVIELNPDADQIARQRDEERKAGKAHGKLFGIPVMVKDNIDTGDHMQTTAGSLAMVGTPALTDATVVVKLRASGAVLLGKTNLSEWANFRS
ncbi:MAG: amidase family protein, partial [Gammaproteobacteria bacterium]